MLIPRFSIRVMLFITSVCAVVSVAFSAALRGQAWAIGVTVQVILLACIFAAYVISFAVAFGLAQIVGRWRASEVRSVGRSESPFATVPTSPFREPTRDNQNDVGSGS